MPSGTVFFGGGIKVEVRWPVNCRLWFKWRKVSALQVMEAVRSDLLKRLNCPNCGQNNFNKAIYRGYLPPWKWNCSKCEKKLRQSKGNTCLKMAQIEFLITPALFISFFVGWKVQAGIFLLFVCLFILDLIFMTVEVCPKKVNIVSQEKSRKRLSD